MRILIILLSLIFSFPAAAQGLPDNSSDPIEITANQTLEWHRNDLQYIARGDARAVQGTVSVTGDTLTADYKSTDRSNIDIWQLTSKDNVTLKNEDSTAYGDKAIYNVETGVATLTGSNLKLVSPEQTITATDKFVYKTNERRATAIGNAKVLRGQDTIKAATIEAIFKEEGSTGNGNQEQSIETLEAKNNVVITTPAEILTGDYAIYRANSNKAEIRGNVKITRGPNILEGARAEVDLTTNISKMFGSEQTGERVRGVFYPKSEDTAKSNAPTQP